MSERPRNDMEQDAKLAAVYRAAALDEPPSALDDTILAAARRAVSAKPRWAGSPFSRSWRVPLSIAAVILFSVSLVTLMREEAPEVAQPPRADAPTADTERKLAEAAPAAGGSATTVAKSLVPEAQRSTSVELKPPLPTSRSDMGIRSNTVAPEPAARSGKETATADQASAAPSPLAKRATPEAFPGAADRHDNKVATPAEQPRQSATEEVRRDSAKAPAETRGRFEAAKPSRSAAAVASAPAPLATPALGPSPAPAAAPDVKTLPEKWLERIEELRKQGSVEEAKTSLAEFRKHYPDYPLPAALKDWARP